KAFADGLAEITIAGKMASQRPLPTQFPDHSPELVYHYVAYNSDKLRNPSTCRRPARRAIPCLSLLSRRRNTPPRRFAPPPHPGLVLSAGNAPSSEFDSQCRGDSRRAAVPSVRFGSARSTHR